MCAAKGWAGRGQAAGEAPLHEPPHVCLLMHVGAAQARTRLQERQRVRPAAAQVRDACDMMPAFPIQSLCVSRRRMFDQNICRQLPHR